MNAAATAAAFNADIILTYYVSVSMSMLRDKEEGERDRELQKHTQNILILIQISLHTYRYLLLYAFRALYTRTSLEEDRPPFFKYAKTAQRMKGRFLIVVEHKNGIKAVQIFFLLKKTNRIFR